MSPKKKSAKTAAKRPSALGANPLDAYLPQAAATKASRRGLAPLGSTPAPVKPERPKRAPKVRATFHLPEGLMEETRNAVLAVRRERPVFTLAAFAEEAFRRELERLKKAHNAGKPFPQMEGRLEGGRPIGS